MTVLALPATTTGTTTSAPLSVGTSVAKPATGVTTASAVALAGDADVVTLLGGGNGASATYNAEGLFNSISNAGKSSTASATAAAATPTVAQELAGAINAPANDDALNALAASQPTGTVDQASAYAAILKATPSAAAGVVSDSYNQGIVATISTYA